MSIIRKLGSFPVIRALALAILVLVPASTAGAIEVDRDELEKSSKERIIFINYEGPHGVISTVEDIYGIGFALGRAVKNGAIKAGDRQKYAVYHSLSGKSGSATLDADVFYLGMDAGVDHIKNLRLILRGFLEGAYDYQPKDAALLAEFTTIYNAVHRGDWTYFEKTYSQQVLSALDKEKTGLSVRFDQWPGQTMMIIPLSGKTKSGTLSTVDTSSLTDKKVVDELRKTDDAGVKTRKDMVDLKEREAAAAKQKAALEREAIADEEKKIADEKAKNEAEKAKLNAEKAQLEKEKAAAAKEAPKKDSQPGATEAQKAADQKSGTQPEDAQKTEAQKAEAAKEQQKIAEKEKTLAEKEKTLAEKEKATAEKESAVAEKKEEAAKAEQFAEKKEKEAVADRKDIAKDQQEVIKKEEAAAAEAAKSQPTGDLALKMITDSGPYARFILLDLSSGTELKQSALDTVRSRSVEVMDDKIIAIAGSTKGSGAVRLIIADKKTLEMTKQGEDDIHADSPLWLHDGKIYAVAVAGGKSKLGIFTMDLKKVALTTDTIHPYATLLFKGDLVFTQAADGSPLVLKAADLSRALK